MTKQIPHSRYTIHSRDSLRILFEVAGLTPEILNTAVISGRATKGGQVVGPTIHPSGTDVELRFPTGELTAGVWTIELWIAFSGDPQQTVARATVTSLAT